MSTAKKLLNNFSNLIGIINDNEVDIAVDIMNNFAIVIDTYGHNTCYWIEMSNYNLIEEFANLMLDYQFNPTNGTSHLIILPNRYFVDFLEDIISNADDFYTTAIWDGNRLIGHDNPKLIITDQSSHRQIYVKTNRAFDSVIVFNSFEEVKYLQNLAQNREIGLDNFVNISNNKLVE